ncbi:MAG TPA: PilZ domain-containing protein [Methylomirabilota bacterium]|nr:PilZ domain-containing protein [Methylomirabilota bacterium]
MVRLDTRRESPVASRQASLLARRAWGSVEHPEQPTRRLERRRAPRFSCALDLEVEWGSAVLPGRLRDISASGMFIETEDPLWIGAGFSARLKLEQPLQVNCFVKRIEPGRGMGVVVSVPEGSFRERYQGFVDSLSRAGS